MEEKIALNVRMKKYEYESRIFLQKKMPVIIRIDGKAFHTFTKHFVKPFDDIMIKAMQETAKYLCEHVSCCKLAYTQSDEISLLLIDTDNPKTEPWFNNNIQKIVSVSASMATLAFNKAFKELVEQYGEERYETSYKQSINNAVFDSRAFSIEPEEVVNYFIFRQQDGIRNSVSAVAQSVFSPKELHGKSTEMLKEMLEKNVDIYFNELPLHKQRGSCIIRNEYMKEDVIRHRWDTDENIPIFAEDKNYINHLFL